MHRRSITITLAVLLSLMALATVSQAGQLFGNRKTVDIILQNNDGSPFCDGMSLVINLNTGLVVGHRTGCLSDAIGGTAGVLFGTRQKGAGVTLRLEPDSFFTVVRDRGTWTHYNIDGTVFTSGKYVKGSPPAAVTLQQGAQASTD